MKNFLIHTDMSTEVLFYSNKYELLCLVYLFIYVMGHFKYPLLSEVFCT